MCPDPKQLVMTILPEPSNVTGSLVEPSAGQNSEDCDLDEDLRENRCCCPTPAAAAARCEVRVSPALYIKVTFTPSRMLLGAKLGGGMVTTMSRMAAQVCPAVARGAQGGVSDQTRRRGGAGRIERSAIPKCRAQESSEGVTQSQTRHLAPPTMSPASAA